MQHQLTKQDIQKMEEEIEYRKLVVRKEALEDMRQRNSRIRMRAVSVIWSE